MTAPAFDPETLLDEARRRSSLDDFGDPSFAEPFRVLCGSLETESPLSSQGRAILYEDVLGKLCDRLQLYDWVRRRPEILEEDVGEPLVIAGLPRTGTTMLYRMLSAADGLTAPLFYEATQLAPDPDWNFDPALDARIPAAEARVGAMMAAMPELAAIYPFEAQAPEESIFLYKPSFVSTGEQSAALVPAYDAWFKTADKRPAYRYLRLALQFLQWQRRRSDRHRQGLRWVLKTPDHLHGFAELLEVFPGARIIQTHRDPIQTIPSICSFIRVLHKPKTARDDSADIGQAWSRMFADSLRQAMAVRARHPDRFLDVWYQDTVAAPRKVAEEVFDFIGQPLTDLGWAEMQKWREANKREGRPAHQYALEEFGLSESGIRTAFEDYRARFIGPRPRNEVEA